MRDWSPVLPAPLLHAVRPLLAAVRRLRPAGPPDLRTADHPVPQRRTVTVAQEDLLQLAAAAGPLEEPLPRWPQPRTPALTATRRCCTTSCRPPRSPGPSR
ncbi:hypothetical protein [Streptomyces apricus]|uniref:Uncharacterized protein n=1 Tax=Streptomyces apricus TaxID=1828112 RepID=A0A5B0AK94_9ACTN|nr:hypothetical protein [Streptomyces apricus]KAA0929139.1 hypothetical protein FGF04_30985 [Streptomyces apricus]